MALFSDATGNYGDNTKTTPVPFPKGVVIGSEADVLVPSLPLTLLSTSKKIQVLNPSSSGDVILPTTSVESGSQFRIENRSTSNTLTIKSSNGDTIDTIYNGYAIVTALQATPTTSAHWYVSDLEYSTDNKVATGVTYVVSGGGAPSGTVDHNYRWYRKNKNVTLIEHVTWTGAGNAVTTIRWDLHAVLPPPAVFGSGNPISVGAVLVSAAGVPVASAVFVYQTVSSQIQFVMASSNVDQVIAQVSYKI